jgi:leucyl aminopeptidase
MTDFAGLSVADRGQKARAIHLVDKHNFSDWVKKRPAEDRALLEAQRFDGKKAFAFAILPRGGEFEVVTAVKDADNLSPWCLARLAESLAEGTYKLAEGEAGPAALGWLLGQYRFDRYRSKKQDCEHGPRVLLTSEAGKIDAAVRIAQATALVRDLVNTPAADLGPAQLEQAARDLANELGAKIRVTIGEELGNGYPLIAAVGAGATEDRAPRLIELEWGKPDAPRIAIVGKGVCFDTGGLDLKPASGMRIMKKDMGGAAHALALARLVIAEQLPVQLHMLIAAVENSVSGAAYRPGDVVKSRKGLSIEVDNTDAEGRLVLADALTRASEENAELIVDFATLTGAARVALGPDLPAMFANDDTLAAAIETSARNVDDPLWRMPLWDPYDENLKSNIADLANMANNAMAGAIYGALFLRRFVSDKIPWAHVDTWAWRDPAKAGRPKGGDALGLRAIFAMLQNRYLQR